MVIVSVEPRLFSEAPNPVSPPRARALAHPKPTPHGRRR